MTTITVQLTAVHFFILMTDSGSMSSDSLSMLRWKFITRPLESTKPLLTEDWQ